MTQQGTGSGLLSRFSVRRSRRDPSSGETRRVLLSRSGCPSGSQHAFDDPATLGVERGALRFEWVSEIDITPGHDSPGGAILGWVSDLASRSGPAQRHLRASGRGPTQLARVGPCRISGCRGCGRCARPARRNPVRGWRSDPLRDSRDQDDRRPDFARYTSRRSQYCRATQGFCIE